MVIEPFVRMGPPPRSLAAEANDCFMVRTCGSNRIPGCGEEFRAQKAGSPRVGCLSSHSIDQATGQDAQRAATQPTLQARRDPHEILLTPKAPSKFRPIRWPKRLRVGLPISIRVRSYGCERSRPVCGFACRHPARQPDRTRSYRLHPYPPSFWTLPPPGGQSIDGILVSITHMGSVRQGEIGGSMRI